MKKTLLTATFASFIFAFNAQTPWFTDLNHDSGSPLKLGTADPTDLSFFTNGIENMTLSKDGNLKISSLVGSDDRLLYVDSDGNIKSRQGGGNTSVSNAPCLMSAMPWYNGGNRYPADNTIGTCSPTDFILKADGKESICIKPNSFVGIGYQNYNPQAALDITDAINYPNSSTTDHLLIYGDALGKIEASGDINLITNGAFNINFGPYLQGSSEKFTIDYLGNTGIGTTPSQKLDIRQGAIQVVNNPMSGTTGGYTYIGRSADPSSGNDSYLYHRITNNYHMIGSNKNGSAGLRKLGFAVGGSDFESDIKMTIEPTGQVWIGPKKPLSPHTDFKFAVDGKVVSKSLYVTALADWADYVFDEEYQLPSLIEIETYYLKYKHLPEVPTTAQVRENGIDIGEMNILLLKKIEELTLYVVDLNKKIEILQFENKKTSHK